MIHTVKGFSIVNEAEVDVFLEFSHFFHYPTVFNNMKGGVKISIFFYYSDIKVRNSIHEKDRHSVTKAE